VGRTQANPLAGPAIREFPKALAVFSIGMAATFTGALILTTWERTPQPQQPVTVAAQNPPAVPAAKTFPPAEQIQPLMPELPPALALDKGLARELNTRVSPAKPEFSSSPNSHLKEIIPSRARQYSPAFYSSQLAHSAPAGNAPGSTFEAKPQQLPFATGQNNSDTPARAQLQTASLPLEPRILVVLSGTSVEVRLTETLSSARLHAGDDFRAALDSPLIIGGLIIAAEDSTVVGRVAKATKAPLLGGKADLTLTLTYIQRPDGSLIRIKTNSIERIGSHGGIVNTAKMATGAALGAVIGAVTGAAEGAGISPGVRNDDRESGFMAAKRTVVIPAGTKITFNLTSPLHVTQQVPDRSGCLRAACDEHRFSGAER